MMIVSPAAFKKWKNQKRPSHGSHLGQSWEFRSSGRNFRRGFRKIGSRPYVNSTVLNSRWKTANFPVSKWHGVWNCMGGLRCSYIRWQLHATAKWYCHHDHDGITRSSWHSEALPNQPPLNLLKHTKTRCYQLDSGRNLVRMPLSFSPHIRSLYWPVPMPRWNTYWSQMKMVQILAMQSQWAG